MILVGVRKERYMHFLEKTVEEFSWELMLQTPSVYVTPCCTWGSVQTIPQDAIIVCHLDLCGGFLRYLFMATWRGNEIPSKSVPLPSSVSLTCNCKILCSPWNFPERITFLSSLPPHISPLCPSTIPLQGLDLCYCFGSLINTCCSMSSALATVTLDAGLFVLLD